MSWLIVGLGNPGGGYKETRHNTGRIFLDWLRLKHNFPSWQEDKKLRALVCEGKIGTEKVKLLLPETMMNNSGKSVGQLVTNETKAKKLIVVHDDLDLPLGAFKISFNRGTGGHRGLDSIVRSIKTRAFVRVRIGIVKKKPKTEKQIVDFILGKFTAVEMSILKRLSKKVLLALETCVADGSQRAMNIFN